MARRDLDELRSIADELAHYESEVVRLKARRAKLWERNVGKLPQRLLAQASGVHETLVSNTLKGRR